jgi:signal transduction histidine kinase
MIIRGKIAAAGLAALCLATLVWQAFEHARVREAAETELINRAHDISTTAGSILRALRRFGVVPRDRLEPALQQLIKPGDVNSIAVLNENEDIVALVGAPMPENLRTHVARGEPVWTEHTVAVMNLVELGTNQVLAAVRTNVAPEINRENPLIVVNDDFGRGTNRGGFNPPPGDGWSPGEGPPPGRGPPPPEFTRQDGRTVVITNQTMTNSNFVGGVEPSDRMDRDRRGRRDRDGRSPFGRPSGMREEDYLAMLSKQGVHSFVIVLATQSAREVIARDLWLRGLVAGLAIIAVLGIGLAYRNLLHSSELEVRLVRASELNTRLKEMNLAAAGLAHETKNPLNIVRGLAQMISRDDNAPPAVRQNSKAIVAETDRVTAQLNEFINYSRPREIRRAVVSLGGIIGEVVRALNYDIEEKAIKVEMADDLPSIEADEQLLRQALFNLILNAVQAAQRGGEIRIRTLRQPGNEVTLEIADNGPGVPLENRTNIFKPYFTTNAKGTGLGLAVVHQIVLAHGWEIACFDNPPRGACFRIWHLRLVAGSRN